MKISDIKSMTQYSHFNDYYFFACYDHPRREWTVRINSSNTISYLTTAVGEIRSFKDIATIYKLLEDLNLSTERIGLTTDRDAEFPKNMVRSYQQQRDDVINGIGNGSLAPVKF